MMNFTDALRTGYAECGCRGPEGGFLLAVSGGADSMALLHGTAQLWPDHSTRIVVGHVNHQLRGDDSRKDAEFVAAAAKSLSLRFRLVNLDWHAGQRTHGGVTEETARQARYHALQDTASNMNLGSVVCGHHQDDQAETILHNILRGTGLRGLAGMSPTRPLSAGVHLMRPMLNISRTATEAFLRSQQRTWRTDASNASTEFTRNRIRHELIPMLSDAFNPQIVSSLLRLAGHARDAETVTERLARRCLDDVILELQPGVCRLCRVRLAEWPETVVRAALRLIWDRQSWPKQAMTCGHWAELAACLVDVTSVPSQLPQVTVTATSSIVRIFKTD